MKRNITRRKVCFDFTASKCVPMAGVAVKGFGRMVHLLTEPISSHSGQSISQQLDRTIKPVTVLQQNTS